MFQVTVLDADVIRTHLSKGLGFSREDRQTNVRRIGYVAGVVVQHNGICIVANIAPYEEDRTFNRRCVSDMGGGYIEVYVSTPLRICEQRDVKELYKKARAGVIKQVCDRFLASLIFLSVIFHFLFPLSISVHWHQRPL